jgi:hypothetical protein
VTSELETVGRQRGIYFSAHELMSMTFPEPKWAVPGLIAEGLNLLVGAPKLGKSWLCLGLAVAVASGGKALGKINVERGSVLYLALEDPARRLQNRLEAVLGADPFPDKLTFATELPRMPDGLRFIDGWLVDHPDARLVIVDVLRKIRPSIDGRGNAYNEDYDTLGALKALADQHGVALVVVHHTRKQVDEGDVFNEVSGSTGLTGAADAILIAKRARNEVDAVLHVTGRDIPEQEYGLSWANETCSWSLLDEPVSIATMPPTQRKIHAHLDAVVSDTPKGISEATALSSGTVKGTLSRMTHKGTVDTDGNGNYFLKVTRNPCNPVTHTVTRLQGLPVTQHPDVPTKTEMEALS